MKNDTDEEQNRTSSDPLKSRGHVHQEMVRGLRLWGQDSRCNFNLLGWDTQIPLSPPLLQEQHTLHSSKVGREDEGVSSNRPELVVLTECLDIHEDDINLLYLTDPQENYNQTVKESSNGNSDSTSEGQRLQGGST